MGARILALDDEVEFPELFHDFLSNFGYEVFTATSVDEALKIMSVTTSDLILTDVVMPRRNGFDFLESVKAMDMNPAIIVMSAFTTDSQRKAAENLGIDVYLDKPVSLQVLKEHIDILMLRPMIL